MGELAHLFHLFKGILYPGGRGRILFIGLAVLGMHVRYYAIEHGQIQTKVCDHKAARMKAVNLLWG